MKQFLKDWTLPVAIFVGVFLYMTFAYVPCLHGPSLVLGPVCHTLLPISVFLTLFVTFIKIDFSLMRIRSWHMAALCSQLCMLTMCMLAFWLLPSSEVWILEVIVACIIAPCASAAPVVTVKLGGDITEMTAYTLISAVATSLLIPAVFSVMEPSLSSFQETFRAILGRMVTVLLLPLALGMAVHKWIKPLYRRVVAMTDLGFYCWAFSLALTTGVTMEHIMNCRMSLVTLTVIAGLSLAVSLLQFLIGRAIGLRFDRQVCAGQAMFQKNTGLAIWITNLYLSPASCIGIGFYVLWQNSINSIQLWHHARTSSQPKQLSRNSH